MTSRAGDLLVRFLSVVGASAALVGCDQTATENRCYSPGVARPMGQGMSTPPPALPCLGQAEAKPWVTYGCETTVVTAGPEQRAAPGGGVSGGAGGGAGAGGGGGAGGAVGAGQMCCYDVEVTNKSGCVDGRPLFVEGALRKAALARGGGWGAA